MRLQCYEGLDEAKALYEWNYRKQLLRIQTEAAGTAWQDVQEDIFSEDFLMARPLLTAISVEEPVVLLIDEIDKTDQEFEAMLLEVLSDFQISIPELGVVEATTQPLVLLTSNNTRELTEALKRRCLYLWLDYPDAERELEIVRLHVPELPDTLTRKLIEIVHMVRNLDLKKPPSIAESIDWARALMLLGATDIDSTVFERTMSIIVKHRTDLDVVAERVGVRLDDGFLGQAERRVTAARLYGGLPEGDPPGLAPQLIRFCDELREEGVKLGTAEILDAFGALGEVSWTEREDFREALAATLAKSQEDRRVFELVFDRFFFRAVEAQAVEKGLKEQRFQGGERIDLDDLQAPDPGRDPAGQRRRHERPRAARGRGLRRPGRELRRDRRGRAADPPHARPAPAGRDGDQAGEGLDRDELRRFEAHLRRELERALIHRTESLPPSKPLAEFDRALPGGPLQDLAQVHRVVAQLKRRLATCGPRAARAAAQPGRGRAAHDARLARDRRRAAAAALPAASGRAGPRSTCCATCPPRSPARASSSCRCCTRCTTRSASCAASPSSSGSTR